MFCFVLSSLTDLSIVRSIKQCINKISNKHYILFPLKLKTPSMFKNYKNYLGIPNIMDMKWTINQLGNQSYYNI